MTREAQARADLMLVPYNYLVDAKVSQWFIRFAARLHDGIVQSRSAQNISVANSIIIFDEAHNIEKSCEEASSFQLTGTQLGQCMVELRHVCSGIHTVMVRL